MILSDRDRADLDNTCGKIRKLSEADDHVTVDYYLSTQQTPPEDELSSHVML